MKKTKIADNYQAKYEIWAKEPKVFPLPKMDIPFKFLPQTFSSYEEFNQWKTELIVQIAEHGGVTWSK